MLGRFAARSDGGDIPGLTGRKVQELLCYLLLFRGKPHRREILADALWGGINTAQSKKYLRQSLWQLHRVIDGHGSPEGPLLLIDPEWIQVNEGADLWLDVAEIESAFESVRGVAGEDLTPDVARRLDSAVGVYRGDLLEGWYQDWCLFERERLRTMYLAMVEKMLGYHERHRRFDEGLLCGDRILRQDRAHERTHRRLMRLHYLAGDRTGALRRYRACVDALREELGVEPSERTLTLYEQIRADERVDGPAHTPAPEDEPSPRAVQPLQQALASLARAERLVQQSLQALRLE